MSQKTHSQDSPSNLEKIWWEMENIEPLTPLTVEDSLRAYKDAAVADSYLFGDYDGFEAYISAVEEG